MSNRLYNQFGYSPERQPINLMGKFTVSVAQTKAALIASGITYTAVAFGTGGNSVTIALTAGGTAGAEVVTVIGNAISVQIEDTVSTRTQVKTAIDASGPAIALISVAVSSGGTVATLIAATNLAGGVATSFSSNALQMSMNQTILGTYNLVMEDDFHNLLSAQVQLLSASAANLVPQIISEATNYASSKTISIRTIKMTDQALVDMVAGNALFVHLIFRNSGS